MIAQGRLSTQDQFFNDTFAKNSHERKCPRCAPLAKLSNDASPFLPYDSAIRTSPLSSPGDVAVCVVDVVHGNGAVLLGQVADRAEIVDQGPEHPVGGRKILGDVLLGQNLTSENQGVWFFR